MLLKMSNRNSSSKDKREYNVYAMFTRTLQWKEILLLMISAFIKFKTERLSLNKELRF